MGRLFYTSTTTFAIARYCICVIDESRTFSIDDQQPTSHLSDLPTIRPEFDGQQLQSYKNCVDCTSGGMPENVFHWIGPMGFAAFSHPHFAFAALHNVSPQHWITVVLKLIWDLLKCCILYMSVCSFGCCKNNYARPSFCSIIFTMRYKSGGVGEK